MKILTNIQIIGAPEKEEKKKGYKKIFAAMKLKDAYSLEGKLWPT